ncbi:hypothetical protein R1sor_003502 [Riccia sorocarpa]|uniref:Uncharacterized protein n=1 Tax=Riccia sorocarpa TaxID=122646 RepID=A0ABD3H566_9MARC
MTKKPKDPAVANGNQRRPDAMNDWRDSGTLRILTAQVSKMEELPQAREVTEIQKTSRLTGIPDRNILRSHSWYRARDEELELRIDRGKSASDCLPVSRGEGLKVIRTTGAVNRNWKRCEAGPQLTMLAEYVLAEKSILDKKTQGLLVGIKDGDAEKTPEKNSSTPDRRRKPEGSKKLEPAGVKPVTERGRKPEPRKASDLFKVANNRSKPVADSPSNRTRGAKRKAEEPSDGEGKHRRRKLQLQEEEEEESSERTSGETLGSESDETTASSDSGGGTEQSTPPYKQDDSTLESEKTRKKFGGRVLVYDHLSGILDVRPAEQSGVLLSPVSCLPC